MNQDEGSVTVVDCCGGETNSAVWKSWTYVESSESDDQSFDQASETRVTVCSLDEAHDDEDD